MAEKTTPREKFQFRYLPLKKLKVWSKVNVRKTDIYIGIEELATSIREIGVQQPLIVKKIKNNYKIIVGQRRFIAAGKANLTEVPCLILNKIDDFSAVIASFTENIHRLEMTDEDKAKTAHELKKILKTNQAVADKLGVHPTTVGRWLSWFEVSDKIKELVSKKDMNFDTARYISEKFSDDDKYAYDVAKEYASKNKNEKSDFYVAIRNSDPTDSIKEINKKFKKIRSTVAYQIRLPSDDSKIVNDMADELNTTPSEVIVKLVIRGLALYKNGQWRI